VHKRKICSPPTSSVGLPTRFFNYFFQKIKEVLRLEDARRTSLSVHSKEKDREQTDLICCSLTQHRVSSQCDYHYICVAIEISFSINKWTQFSKKVLVWTKSWWKQKLVKTQHKYTIRWVKMRLGIGVMHRNTECRYRTPWGAPDRHLYNI